MSRRAIRSLTIAAVVCMLPLRVLAADVAIVSSSDIIPYNTCIEGIKEALSDLSLQTTVLPPDTEDALEKIKDIRSNSPRLMIAIGPQAAFAMAADKGMIIEKLEDYLKHPRLPPEAASIARREKKQFEELVLYRDELRAFIEALGVLRFREELGILIGVNGISVFGAACIMADIITIDRFRSHKNLASYLSAAPRVDASNNTVHIGRLNKSGRKMSFEILLQSVNHLVDGNPHLLAYTERKNGKSKNKIRATIVARSIRQVFYMLKNREENRFINLVSYKTKKRHMEKILETQKSA